MIKSQHAFPLFSFLLLLFFPIICQAKLVNDFTQTVYFIPEDSATIHALAAGKTYENAIDFITMPELEKNKIYKVVDFISVTVNKAGEIEFSAGNPVSWLMQTLIGGWAPRPKHHPLSRLFNDNKANKPGKEK